MAQPWCTGAVHIYCNVDDRPGEITRRYLGTAETSPIIEGQHKFEQVMNDLSGAAPFDFSYLGRVEVITVTLTRYNEDIYQSVIAPINFLTRDTFLDIGTLMQTERVNGSLWLRYPYSVKTAMASMEPGRHYFNTILFDPHRIQVGTRAKKVTLTWLAWSQYNPATGDFVLFDFDLTGLPAID
jgi:hypothetical protein